MQVGRTGNEVLAAFDARMRAEGIAGTMYSHAIGDHGHAAGPTVGLHELANQPVLIKGDVRRRRHPAFGDVVPPPPRLDDLCFCFVFLFFSKISREMTGIYHMILHSTTVP